MRMCSCNHCNYFARLDRPSIPKMIFASLKAHNRVSFDRLYAFIFANYPFGSMDSEAIVRKHLQALVKAKKIGVLMIKNKLRYVNYISPYDIQVPPNYMHLIERAREQINGSREDVQTQEQEMNYNTGGISTSFSSDNEGHFCVC